MSDGRYVCTRMLQQSSTLAVGNAAARDGKTLIFHVIRQLSTNEKRCLESCSYRTIVRARM